ncbi:hypothetical protein E2C01_000740 [Portunus trituberculatus]|uniref:Uncharacterized protein n=1 Tax=Portunus trituberculatus TaxID=210409 RepID=A0A5B7CHD6_PORTR|nr:hypothetical protein [Portunus trituberculatus]
MLGLMNEIKTLEYLRKTHPSYASDTQRWSEVPRNVHVAGQTPYPMTAGDNATLVILPKQQQTIKLKSK